MCARLINDSKFNNLIATDTEITFQKVLLKKCHDVFYSNYQEELNKLKDTMKNDNMVNIVMLSLYFVMTYDYYHLWFSTYY